MEQTHSNLPASASLGLKVYATIHLFKCKSNAFIMTLSYMSHNLGYFCLGYIYYFLCVFKLKIHNCNIFSIAVNIEFSNFRHAVC